jgi:hypothetical protein
MCRRLLLSLILIMGLFNTAVWAEPIEVENFSFELPGTSKQQNWANVPGWSSDTAATDSGVETGYTPTDGEWTAFIRNSDSSIWQLTDHVVTWGDVFELKVDARITWAATTMLMILYYDDNGARVQAASSEVTLTDDMQEYTLIFDSTDAPDSVGHQIGIEFDNANTGDNWIGIDNVRLELVQMGAETNAFGPSPADGQIDVPRDDVILSWTSGEFADKHDVYLGTGFDDVNNAGTDSPLLISPAQDANSYNAGRLDFGRIYFWRVDEVNAPPDTTVYKGPVWSFTIETYAYPIPAERITATASSSLEGNGPENTINGSGLDVNDLHSTNTNAMWLSDSSEPGSTWIQYEFDKPYKLHQMLVWNYNGPLILFSYGIKEVAVEYSIDGTNWIAIDSVTEFSQAPGTSDYAYNTTVDFGGEAVKYVRIIAYGNWSGGFLQQYGLSEVCFMSVPVDAREPSPADGATDIMINDHVTLSWRAGREAAEHNVYLSTDQQQVIDGTAPVVTVAQTNYGPLSLELGNPYYWRIDEVNNNEPTTIWRGDIWNFEVQEYFVIDDFESYNDLNPDEQDSKRIFLTWIDGFENPTVNGATMGYPDPVFVNDEHFVETVIVRTGAQSAPLLYDNSTASYSEVTVSTNDLAIGPDWSMGGVQTLVLWFFGDPNNAITEQLYVKINGTKVLYDGDPANIAIRRWTQWNVDLTSLGVNLSNVTTFSIGFERTGATGGSGIVFIDDIQLYKSAPPIPVPTEPEDVGLVAYYAMDNNAQDVSGNGLDGTLMGGPTFIAGVSGLALSLDGVDDYVDCGNSASFDITEEITLSAWVNTSDSGNGEDNPFVAKGDESYAIKHSDSNSIDFFIYDNEDWHTAYSPVYDSFNGEWYHVAGTYDGNQLKLYINGGLVNSLDYAGSIGTSTYPVNIGRNSQETGRFYEGAIDEVRIYNRALTESEILYLADQYIK